LALRRLLVCCLLAILLPACGDPDPADPGTPEVPHTDVYVTNFSAEMVLAVYLRPAGAAAWGENLLSQPIRGGALYTYVGRVVSGIFDVRMVGQVSTQETPAIAIVGDALGIAFSVVPPSP